MSRAWAGIESALHPLGEGLEVLDLPVVTLMEDIVVAALTAVMAGVGPCEREDGADAVAIAPGAGRRRRRVDGIAVVQ